MSEHRHTSGPWSFDGSEIRTPSGQLRTTGLTLICGSGDKTEEESNARLIAAAPEMLEALQGILTLIQESHGVFGFHLNGDLSDWSEHQDDINLIQNAIAKATGKENA
jgi:hypothetical protein